MNRLSTILVLLATLNFVNGQSSYFPFEKGSSFTYAYGSELYQGTYDHMRIKVETLNNTKMIDGKEYFITETSTGSDDNFSKISTSYVRTAKDGSVFTIQAEGEKEYLSIQAMPKVGDKWASKNGKISTTTLVTETNGNIKTDNKTYTDCLVLEQKSEDGTVTKSYFQKNVGMVATTLVVEGSEKIFIHLVNE